MEIVNNKHGINEKEISYKLKLNILTVRNELTILVNRNYINSHRIIKTGHIIRAFYITKKGLKALKEMKNL